MRLCVRLADTDWLLDCDWLPVDFCERLCVREGVPVVENVCVVDAVTVTDELCVTLGVSVSEAVSV